MTTRIGIDTGGTFTDVVRWTKTGLQVQKVPSTPADPGLAVLRGLALARRRPDEPVDVVHGTTVGLNAVLTGRLARTVFVTNAGFEDLIEIGRQDRPDLYALEPERAAMPVPRELRIGVPVRRGADGEALVPLTDRVVAATVARVRRLRPASVAVGLLHAPQAPADEQRLAAALRRALPDVAVTCSAELWPAIGEFERFTAAILNAATQPLVGAYTARLRSGLGVGELRLMRSSLGIMPADEAARFPARAMFSGPAGGVLAAARLGEAMGSTRLAAFDMGGTSTDVCLVQRHALLTDQGRIAELPLPLPAVDVHTVGCGGGSIAFVDRGGALRVGPASAGADPGPACYGKGSEPTVTDAHVALGHLGPDTLLGGGFPIDPAAAVRAIERLARRLGLSALRTARGILEVAEANMARALMVITVERAVDPATVPLVAYGGAGGLHAATLAARLGMPSALVPEHPGAFSAVGLCLAGETAELAEPLVLPLADPRAERDLRRRARALLVRAQAILPGTGRARGQAEVVLRYRGQGQGLRLPLGPGRLLASLAMAHARRFGFVPEGAPAEAIMILARAERPGRRLPPPASPRSGTLRGANRRAPVGTGRIGVLPRAELPMGTVWPGPVVLEELTGATLVPGGWAARATAYGLELIPPKVGGKAIDSRRNRVKNSP